MFSIKKYETKCKSSPTVDQEGKNQNNKISFKVVAMQLAALLKLSFPYAPVPENFLSSSSLELLLVKGFKRL